MFLSIIIPVFNVEKYISVCLDSILACNLSDCEILLVLGNSTDKSTEVCMSYAKNNDNIFVLLQKETGLSDARNCGMDRSTGKYIIFIDSDDYVISEKFEVTLGKLRSNELADVEVFVSDYNMVFDSGELLSEIKQIRNDENIIKEYDYLNTFLKQPGCFWNVWRYIYRRDFLERNKFQFKKGYLSEDIDFTIKILLRAKNLVFFHNPYYQYRIGRDMSLMNVPTYKRAHDTITLIEDNIRLLQENKQYTFGQDIIEHLVFEWISNLALIYEVEVKDRMKTWELFNSTKYLISYSQDKIYRGIVLVVKLLGIKFAAFFIEILKKIKRRYKKFKFKN